MKLPLWYKARNGKWVQLTYFPDGEVGLTMGQVLDHELIPYPGHGRGMGHLDPMKISYDGGGRFILRKEE